jgi:hypothetical protein
MNFIEEQRQQSEQNKRLFLDRVNQLFDDINVWIKEENLYLEQQRIEITEEIIGTYTAPKLSIHTASQQKLVEIIPIYAFSIVAEGLMDIRGQLGKEYIAYLRPSEQTIYHIGNDNWYWIENMSHSRVYVMNKSRLFEIITLVSDYSFS